MGNTGALHCGLVFCFLLNWVNDLRFIRTLHLDCGGVHVIELIIFEGQKLVGTDMKGVVFILVKFLDEFEIFPFNQFAIICLIIIVLFNVEGNRLLVSENE